MIKVTIKILGVMNIIVKIFLNVRSENERNPLEIISEIQR